MNLNRINIKNVKSSNSIYQNVNFEVRIPSRIHYVELWFRILILITTVITPIFFFILNTYLVFNNYSNNPNSQNAQVQCCSFIGTLIYYLISYKAIIKPLVKSIRKITRFSINPEITFSDLRPPVLLLRSFLSDNEENLERIDQRTPEERLVEVLKTIGPVLTAGQPGEEGLPLLGATRIYLDENWDKSIVELMKVANIVVIDASNTKSLAWEMLCVRNLVHPRRVLISFLTKQNSIDYKTEILEAKRSFELFYRSFSTTFHKSFDVALPEFDPNTFLIQFDDSWNPHPIIFLPNLTNQSKTMKYVSADNLLAGLSSFFINLKNLNTTSEIQLRSEIESLPENLKDTH